LILTREVAALPAPGRSGSVVSVGVFDGVHLGHAAILRANVGRARALGAAPTVVTFSEHPKRVLLGRSPRTLTSLEHRLELFRRAGIEHTLALDFDEDLRRVPAEEFTDKVLVRGLGARAFVLGFDSKFGRDRRGTPELLRALGHDVQVVEKVEIGGRAVSSTAIREAVELGDLASAERMLGRRVSVLGTVVQGDHLGSRLGFPTANLDLHHELHPPPGVYAGRARLLDPGHLAPPSEDAVHGAVANIGTRPTVEGGAAVRLRVEVHLFDFAGDLYGRDLELEFIARLRDERRFADLRELADQIGRDTDTARAVLARDARGRD
jgi:riboflavin kinase/FMN adenylyltransferase